MLMRTLNRQRWPMFYQQIAGGMLATALALLVARLGEQLDLTVDTSQVITASIVLLLSGIGFMGAIQDALCGFYLTAGARIIEALLATAGLIAGVSAGLSLARPAGGEPGRRASRQRRGLRRRAAGPGRGDRLGLRVRVHLLRAAARAAGDRDEHPARSPGVRLGAGPGPVDAVGGRAARPW